MRIIFIIVITLAGYFHIQSQDFNSEFQKLIKEEDSDSLIEAHLTKWQKSKPNDVDFFVAGFVYYFNKAHHEVVQLQNEPGEGDNLEIQDSSGDFAGYLYSNHELNDSLFQIAINYANGGIKINPRRLDIYFGKIHVYGLVEKYSLYLNEIMNVIDLDDKFNYNWLWTDNKPLENPKEVFRSTIQQYCVDLMQMEEPKCDLVKIISERMAPLYPNSPDFISNLGYCCTINHEYSKALEYFIKASNADPNNFIDLANIARCYELLNDNKKALEYYEKALPLGDEEQKEDAKNKIEELKKSIK